MHPVASAVRSDTVESVQRFIRAGYDVNIVSPRGNGNTEFLRHLRSELQETEHDVFLLCGLGDSAEDLPVSFIHELGVTNLSPGPDQLRALLARLERRVRSATCVLLCDSPEILTPLMQRLITLARERIRVQLVMHSHDPLASFGCGGVTCTVELPLLTVEETHAVLAYRLGAPLHQGTLARIYSKAAGLIKLSTLLVDVGRIEEKMRLVDGRWIAVGDLWSIAMQAEINAYDAHRSDEHAAAVQVLSHRRVTKLSDAVREFGATVMDSLERSGAVTVSPTGSNHWVTVTPPLLAERDVRAMTVSRHLELSSQFAPALGAMAVQGRFLGARMTAGMPGNDPVFLRRLSAYRTQRLMQAEQLWELQPNAENAIALLCAMHPAANNAQHILALINTARDAENPTEYLAYLRVWEGWIHGYVLGDLERATQLLNDTSSMSVYAGILQAAHLRMLVDLDHVPQSALESLPVDDDDLPVIVRNELHRCRAYVALVTGQLSLAIAELSHVSSWAEDLFPYQQTVHLSLATLLSGDLSKAYEIALRGCELACDDLDERALRMHCYVISLIAVCRGDSGEAQAIIDVIRGLGDRPVVACLGHMGALMNASLVVARTAAESREVLSYVQAYSEADGAIPCTSQVLLEAKILFIEGNAQSAADLCWAFALTQHERGRLSAAVFSALHSLEYARQEDRVELTQLWITRTDSEFFMVQGEYHAAMLHEQPEQLSFALTRLIACGLLLLARQAVTALRTMLDTTGYALSSGAAMQYRLAAESLGLSEQNSPDGLQLDTALTSREFEVAQLLERGLTNREIQETLVLSIRTVENHVHRILAKLGVNSRGEAITMIRVWMAQHVR